MPPRSSKDSSTGYPEFAVKRETFNRFFDSPLPTSTFHDLVNKGKILPVKGIRGFYQLNASLRRLGLREVPNLSEDASERSSEDILRLAFNQIDPVVFPLPSWTLVVEGPAPKDISHAAVIAQLHRDNIEELGSVEEKEAYFLAVLDAQANPSHVCRFWAATGTSASPESGPTNAPKTTNPLIAPVLDPPYSGRLPGTACRGRSPDAVCANLRPVHTVPCHQVRWYS